MKRVEVTDAAHKLIMREKKRLKGVKVSEVVDQLIRGSAGAKRK